MSLDQKDLELIERIIYKCGDDIAIAIGRSFEHLEERIDGVESRMYSRLADVEERIEDSHQSSVDCFDLIREDIRGLDQEEV
ncbi:MAG: hypothetical protein WCW03_00875 [Candidatus Paceibacterota bacterium]|jgi:hypothetical protein